MKIKEYGSGKKGDVANDLGNREKGDRKRERGSGHRPVVNIVETQREREEKS